MEYIDTLGDFKEVLSNNNKVLVDFTASWCGPCKMIGPQVESQLVPEFKGIKFVKVDVDKNSETSEKYGISAMPTFFAFFNKEKVDEVVGASLPKIRAVCEKLAKM